MFDPASPQRNCAHCKSSKMEYYGATVHNFTVYYKCSKCQKYTEYRIGFKNLLILSSIILLMMVFSFAGPLSVLDGNPQLAIWASIGCVVLCLIVIYRYGMYFYESVALRDLPTDLLIFPAPNKKVRFVIVTILIVALLAYAGIFIFNVIRG